MPSINYNDPKMTDWVKNATYVLGVPLHPLGEVNVYDFYTMTSGDIEEQRLRLRGTQLELVVCVFVTFLFGYNMISSSKMVAIRPTAFNSWCCFIPSVTGSSVARCSSPDITSESLPGTLSTEMGHAELGCVVYYPASILWYWFSIHTPLNVFFSAIFCHVAYRQYKLFGSDAWKRLTQDGIQTMCLAVLCNIICCILAITRINDSNSDMFLCADWVIVITLLINHCKKTRKSINRDHRPKTSHILHISQIVTAVTTRQDESNRIQHTNDTR
ncbi:hypothetical protein BDF22DRAFT_745435 [Syncephalis plumigaleata]|nr:hypothetical protein BDF22DRAFT_745435 [Syncephalis plumigaleata]